MTNYAVAGSPDGFEHRNEPGRDAFATPLFSNDILVYSKLALEFRWVERMSMEMVVFSWWKSTMVCIPEAYRSSTSVLITWQPHTFFKSEAMASNK